MKKDLTNEIIENMFKIFRHLKEEMSFKNSFINLSLLQIQALIFIKQNEKSQMREISHHFNIELPSATSLVNNLHKLQLVERFNDPEDRRLVRISLTSKGKSLLNRVKNQRKKKLEKILSYLSENEKNELLHIFKTLNERINN